MVGTVARTGAEAMEDPDMVVVEGTQVAEALVEGEGKAVVAAEILILSSWHVRTSQICQVHSSCPL